MNWFWQTGIVRSFRGAVPAMTNPCEGGSTVTDYRKLFDLTGKTAVVLGAASGIGKASAEALAGLAARLICADRNREGGEATASGIRDSGGVAEAVVTDAADPSEVNALAET